MQTLEDLVGGMREIQYLRGFSREGVSWRLRDDEGLVALKLMCWDLCRKGGGEEGDCR
jgi:hypothetical protein